MTATFPRNPAAPAPGSAVSRAAYAHFMSAARATDGTIDDFAAKRWPTDGAAQALVRASVSPSTSGDHAGLIARETREFLSALPQSAGARLMAQSLAVSLARDASATIPFDDTAVDAAAPWVGEGDPIPVAEGVTAALTLGPSRKLGIIITASRNLARQPTGAGILKRMLEARAARAFDAALFSTDAGSDTVVAGLLNGVSATAPLSLSTRDVLAELGNALAEAGGSGSIIIVAHPGAAAAIQIDHTQLAWPILPSPALPAGRVVAIDPAGLVFGSGATIDVLTTNAALVHMSSTPGPIVDTTTADPVAELFQVDAIAMRLLVDVAWAARPGAVQFVDGAF